MPLHHWFVVLVTAVAVGSVGLEDWAGRSLTSTSRGQELTGVCSPCSSGVLSPYESAVCNKAPSPTLECPPLLGTRSSLLSCPLSPRMRHYFHTEEQSNDSQPSLLGEGGEFQDTNRMLEL